MQFWNRTPLPAAVVPNAEDDDRMTVLFLCAITYRIAHGKLEIAPGQRPLVLRADGPHPPDGMFDKQGVSVCATGFVYPKKSPAREATALLRVGSRDAPIVVLGQRVWQKAMLYGQPAPSAPLPFERVAMTWENAYGGMTEEPARIVKMDGDEIFVPAHEGGFAQNFNGKGFYTDPARAVDQPLPQLEDPERPIRRWDDRPDPVCFAPYPMWGGLRATHVYHDEKLDVAGAKKLGNKASPRGTFDALEPGAPISLVGMRPGGGALSFDVPPAPAAVDLWLGGRAERALLAVDSVDIDAEAEEVRFLYRATVNYDLIQFELRLARLEPTDSFPVA